MGRYRYLGGVNAAAVVALAAGVAVYYAVPHSWVKAAWGAAVGAIVYLALARAAARAPEAAAEAAGD
jgi:cytosine/uracil/thiamine/allantoin permease